ncbi:MAG: sensor domain-containing protein [Chloroflexi bacterium]|nr:sensor domain-containing protein [Chloroflexota bacterium]
MNEAFSRVYGGYGSPLTKVFGPVLAPRTYLRAVHLLLMFPLGLAYFVGLVVALSIGGVLIWTIVGAVVLIPTLYLTRWAGDIEAWVVRRVAQIELRRPPTAIDLGQSFQSQLWTRLIDRNTWTGLIYLFAQFPIGLGVFVGLAVMSAVAGMFIGAPFVTAVSDAEFDIFGLLTSELNTWPEGFALVPIGLMIFLIEVHLVNTVSALHAIWARFMLASRAKTIPTTLSLAEQPYQKDGREEPRLSSKSRARKSPETGGSGGIGDRSHGCLSGLRLLVTSGHDRISWSVRVGSRPGDLTR